jgi:hypothetical protein
MTASRPERPSLPALKGRCSQFFPFLPLAQGKQ